LKRHHHSCHAIVALHNYTGRGYPVIREGHLETNPMGFFTELFMRPRSRTDDRYRAALAVLNAMSPADRADIAIKPADFPRIARQMSLR
jgi:uncharacterized protein YjiS (DUF1127 family)